MNWIKTADRMPEDRQDILFWNTEPIPFWHIEDGRLDCVEAGYYEDGVFWTECGDRVSEKYVTHWMPFPDPPEEE